MSEPKPSVLIVGAGLAGLLLGILLERANIPYQIFERAAEVKKLGAVMSLNANILPVFEQLGLFDELLEISFPIYSTNMYKEDMELIADISMDGLKDLVGYDYVAFSRPDLYNLLYSKTPKEKIMFKKKILSLQQNENGVMIRVADGTTYHGDILVGSDGAYSGVRQSLYKEMQKKKILPASDAKQMCINFSTMVGTTNPLGQDFHEHLQDPFAHFSLMIGKDSPYTWSTFTVPDSRICWAVQIQLDSKSSEDEGFRNSEWSAEANEGMMKEVNEFQTPYGRLGKLIEATDKDRISKVFLEDKMFETWYHGRTVLIGDAAHKLLPSSGQGAVNAMQDAVILANCIYDIASVMPEEVTAMFKDYRRQRRPHVQAQYEESKTNAKVMYGQKWWERVLRHVVFKYLPKSVQTKSVIREVSYRPQATFLPQTANRGTTEVMPQKPSKRYMAQPQSQSQQQPQQQPQPQQQQQQQQQPQQQPQRRLLSSLASKSKSKHKGVEADRK
ncbi:hypothetical protein BG011_003953 [Mortierella polycephala]|uniref:FAD-binding domain-containing protein n=1 Tax=Mortierella polycephala TaxID=41804 RepID=A0A9P6Q326_9FUNG|nr:hypothetical protein BG011_003953 [Mortierella polycephala]